MSSEIYLSEKEERMTIIDYKLFDQYLSDALPIQSRTIAILLNNALKYFNNGYTCYSYLVALGRSKLYAPVNSKSLSKIAVEARCCLLERLKQNLLNPFAEEDNKHDLDAIDVVIDFSTAGEINIRMKKVSDVYRTEMVQDKNNLVILTKEKGVANWLVKVPLISVFKGAKDYGKYSGYSHAIRDTNKGKSFVYTGITKRGWLTRMKEHYREMKSGGNKLFHKAWREFSKGKDLTIVSELCIASSDYESIMSWEERNVDFLMNAGVSLNMIAGGFKGIRELHKLGLLADRNASLKDRDKALRVLQERGGYKNEHVPNLITSDLWKDDDYASRVICSREDTLSRSQVIKIRELSAMKKGLNSILVAVNASSIRQVKDVISGKYYSRVV